MTKHYAIVDSAQRPHFQERLEKLRTPYCSLFDGTSEEALKDIAPLLIEHTGNLTEESLLNRELRNLGEHKPAVSYIVSDTSIDALAKHFRNFHLIRVPEQGGREMLLRWYDTRILPIWLQLLNPDQHAAFFSPISEWLYFDRFGDMHELPLPDPLTEGFPALPPLSLDKGQYDQLLDACEPDAAIAQLRRVIPDELRQIPLRRLYPFVETHLRDSLAHGTVMLDEHVQYLLLALYTSGEFRNHPTTINRLARPANAWPESLTDWAMNLPEDIWSTGVPLWRLDAELSAAARTSPS